MSYKKDLENAKNYLDCQTAYEKECAKRYKKYVKEEGEDSAFTHMVAIGFSLWFDAQMRLRELGIYGKDIVSKY
ncbi:hypothetical protein [Enterococcus cecorum]|uniref:hypothetical protein n=1 Tax=Enterococcus cecorum TaxID=44008 RepID=UPI0006417329|nr:hypothetical protein [Enterococcus cecorum]KLN95192.1 hypothetical protein ABT60_01375 [Enterococcus cecorum]